MPAIFKHIRRKLAEENKVTSYLRYAVGEILLVVIGILIALQVNNWNEANKSREQLVEDLHTIERNLRSDSLELANNIKTGERVTGYFNRILNSPNDSTYNLDDFFTYMGAPAVEVNSAGYTSALNENILSVIKNEQLRLTLINYYKSDFSLIKRLQENMLSSSNIMVQTILDKTMALGNSGSLANQMSLILENEAFQKVFQKYKHDSDGMLARLKKRLAGINEIKKLIATELKQ